MASGLSLANKCQLLFGVAVVVLLAGVLAVPWFRSVSLVEDAQLEIVRQLADTQLGSLDSSSTTRTVTPAEARVSSKLFLRTALENFESDPELSEQFEQTDVGGDPRILYVRAVRNEGEVVAMVLVDRPGAFGAGQLLTSRIFIIAAGIFAGLIAILVFYLILTKLIFSPVRALRETTELVERGDLDARSQIKTGDDFEQLSRAFNRMLDELGRSQSRLTSMNESLDLKVTELAEANIGLFESNRLKSEFLANISHELKTPLNSIIGFAELLEEMAAENGDPDEKQLRYLHNIVSSGRSLLDMINELLQMAKIEAGRVEVTLEPCSIADLLEGLRAIMRPQAENKIIDLQVRVPDGIPAVETDPGKLQQILYNFLSNAIRFSPNNGSVLISVHRVSRQDGQPGVRIGVTDEGPGIPYDMQDAVFEKFRQVDASHTREHSGTGLGLAICRELAALLGATVSLVSEPGNGATFSVEIPLSWQNEDLLPLIAQPRRV
ncbi:MAG: HAMP domain-containing sensor histidine kinase [Phycisphaerales bacterium]|nr:HAMP domain-containing sensor histidine kinase [Phycisphaerales bacterium]